MKQKFITSQVCPTSQGKPRLIAVHAFNGKPMANEEREKFIDGALSTADNAADSFQTDLVVEDEWTHQ